MKLERFARLTGAEFAALSPTRRRSRTFRAVPILAELVALSPRRHWISLCQDAVIPCAAVRSVGEALDAPETSARQMVLPVDNRLAGQIRLVASPIRLSRTPVVQPTAPPTLGEHTQSVFGFEGLQLDGQ